MNITELDSVISEILEKEAKKLIREQIDNVDHLIDSVKSFQSLSGLHDKIAEIQNDGSNGSVIYIKDVKPEELVHCCGGASLGEAQKNLMQGLHHDLEDNGFGSDFDVDIETAGDENSLQLTIKITPNNDKSLTDMKEQTKDTNPTAKEKKDVILGGTKPQEATEQWEELAADVLEPAIKDAATQFISGKIQDKLDDSNEEEVDESDKKWIQKAVDPKHKGYCTPMTKSTCTPARKALAKRFKKGIDESEGKRIISLTETEMKELITKILKEAVVAPSGGVLPGGVPGLDITKRVNKENGDENDAALKAVEAKIKKYLSFKGNDNPEFPNQIGQGEEKARVNSEEQDEVVADNRGRGPQDLDYDNSDPNTGEPPKEFKERLKMSLIGDPKMGNSQDAAGVIKTKTGEKILKNIERRKENFKKEPIYPKEAVPVKTKTEEELRPVNEEIKRMKQMLGYNEKTQ